MIEITSPKQLKVLSMIKAKQPITRQELGLEMGWAINKVTGRVRELLDLGAIVVQGKQVKNNKSRGLLRIA